MKLLKLSIVINSRKDFKNQKQIIIIENIKLLKLSTTIINSFLKIQYFIL